MPIQVEPPEMDVPDDAWEEDGSDEDPSSRLLTAVVLNGYHFHLWAFAVVNGETQEVADTLFRENLEGVYSVGEPDKRYQTVHIKGRDYVLSLTPYC
jgi:hypothetical protein